MKAARPIRSKLLALAFLVFASAAAAKDGALQTVTVVTGTGRHDFQSEIAATATERAKGLMFRTRLAPGHAMLFDFGGERQIAMWMKNTYVALDMVFIARSGRVLAIAENTVPESTEIISPAMPAYAVLEVNAGTAARIGLAAGDQVEHRIFAQDR